MQLSMILDRQTARLIIGGLAMLDKANQRIACEEKGVSVVRQALGGGTVAYELYSSDMIDSLGSGRGLESCAD